MKRGLSRAQPTPLPDAPPRSGQPLAAETQALLEPRFDHDFSGVRVYNDDHAHAQAAALEARAFTVGQDVYFGAGAYRPHTEAGLGLIAHELAHTVQQRGAAQGEALAVTEPGHESELEASQASSQVLAGQPARLSPVGTQTIARQPASEPESEASKAQNATSNLPWLNGFNPNWLWNLSGSGLTGTSTDGTTTRTQRADMSFEDGFGFNLGQRRVIEGDQDHALESEHALSLKDGALGWLWGSGGRSLADDGTKRADSRREQISLSRDGFGLESSTSSTRDTVTTSRSSSVELKDGEWKAGFERGRDFKLDDDHALSSKTKASFGSDGFNLSRGNDSRIKDIETGAVNAESKSTGFGYGKDGFSASRNRAQTTEIDGQKFTTGSSTAYSGGNLTRTSERSHTSTNEDGKEVTTSSSKGYSVGKDGLGYQTSKTDAQGNTSSASVNAKAGLDESGNLNNLQLSGGLSRNGKSVSVHGGYSVEAGEPRRQGEAWVVDWSRTLSAGGKAGGAKGPVSFGAGGSYTDREFGTRSFKSKAEAEAFQKDAAARLPSHAHDPGTAQGAMQLGIGESQGHSHSLDGSLSGGIGFAGGGSIGVGGTRSSNESLSVRRVSAEVFEVTSQSGGGSGKNFSMANFVGGATAHSASDHSASRTLRFDLSTPDGRAAFEAYNKDPDQIPAKGARVVSSTVAKGEDSGTTVSLPGHSNDRTSRTEEAVTQDEAGKLERYTGKATETISTSLPFFGDSHDNVAVQFDATERNDRDSRYALSGSVDSDEGADSRRHLAALTSSAYRGDNDAKSSGKWGVEVEITDQMVNQFMKEVGTERVREMIGSDPRNALREHLRDAKTSDDKKRALARFFADDGFDGKAIRQMREVLTGGYANDMSFAQDYESKKNNKRGNLNYDLTLPGDRNFQGMGARLELEGKIKGFQNLMSSNPAAAGTLHGQIAPLLEEVRRQRAEINDPKRYTDLPDELRERQVARLDGYIETLNDLRAQSGEKLVEADAAKPADHKKGSKAPAPESGPLKELGAEIAEWSGNIKSDQSAFQFQKTEYTTLRKRQARLGRQLEGGSAIGKLESEALGFAERAKKLNPRIDDLRAAYLQQRGDPAQATKALETGAKLKELLQTQSDLWQDASNSMENARNRLETMLDEAEEAQKPVQPTSMALPEPKRKRGR